MNTRLAAAIESLLRGNWRVPLGPGHARDPVLGALSIVRPTGEQVLLSPDQWPGATALRMEPGLLCLPSVRADIVYPLLLERPTWLASWAAGTGAAIPDADPARTTLLLGELATTPDLVPPYDWPDGADYEGLLYSSAEAMQRVLDTSVAATRVSYPATPGTGWEQLWREACLASGRLFSDRVPPGCTTAPGAVGLVWSSVDPETGVPTAWAIDVDSVGLWAWEMECSTLTLPTLVALAAGDYIGDAAHMAWLYVLADLVPVGGQDAEPQIVLDQAGMAAAYAAGGPLFMRGWHWHPYSAGGLPAAKCINGDVWQPGQSGQGFATQEVGLSITPAHAGGTCTATVSAGSVAYWRPYWGYHRLHVGDDMSDLWLVRGGALYPMDDGAQGQAGCSDSAPVLGWYTTAGVWETLKYYKYRVTNDATAGDYTGDPTCTGSVTRVVTAASFSRWHGGYGIVEPDPTLAGSGTREVYVGTITLSGTGNWGSWNPGNAPGFWVSGEAFGGCGATYLDVVIPPVPSGCIAWSGHHELRNHTALASVSYTYDTFTNAAAVSVWAYARNRPSAIWHRRATTTTSWGRQRDVYERSTLYQQDERYIRTFGCPDGYNIVEASSAVVSGYPKHGLGHFGSSNGLDLLNQSSTRISRVQTGGGGEFEPLAWCRIAGIEYPGDAAVSGWGPLWSGNGAEPVSLVVDALVSARGSKIYRPTPGEEWESNAGIPPSVAAAAHSWAGA